jgi:preprotein translocase subunit SecY
MQARQNRPRLLQAMIDAFSLPDLRRRILITFGILVAFRFIAHVPLPGVDLDALAKLFESNALFGMLNMFSGGAMKNLSVAALGVYPYITSSIVMTLLMPIIPRLQALSMEGEAGRDKINRITHWLTIPMAALQGWGQLAVFMREGVITSSGPLDMITMIMTLIAGTMFLVWLGERITEYGIGNGISIIIFGGIVAGYWETAGQVFVSAGQGQWMGAAVYLFIALATVVLIVIFTEAHRRIPVQYSKSVFRGGRMYRQAGSTHIPLRVNTSGMIPLIFAVSIVTFPGVVASYFANASSATPNLANHIMTLFSSSAPLPSGLIYWGLYFLLTVGFAFFYTGVIFEQQDLPGTLQKQGGFIPGIRPGTHTKEYLNGVIRRITWAGALFLALVAIMPFLAREFTDVQAIQLSSMGMLIVVGVVLDTMKQMEAQLLMRHYEGFIK